VTLELLHGIRYYTLTKTSIPNHASHKQDMKYYILLLHATGGVLFTIHVLSILDM